MNSPKAQPTIEDCYPLSMLQQGMIFHSLQHPQLSVYHDVLTYQLNLVWQENAFTAVMSHLIAKHPMLRTLFNLDQARPLQLVLKQVKAPLEIVDLTELSMADSQSKVEQWVKAEKQRGFDFSQLPWRLGVFKIAADKLVLGLSFHHALWDGWSNGNLINEMLTLYQQMCEQGQMTTTPAPPSYKHFIVNEQKALADKAQHAHWQSFEDAPLPWFSGAREQTSEQHIHSFSAEQSEKISAFASRLGVQDKSVWHGVYLLLLSMLCGKNDVVGSVVIHGRPAIPGSDKTIGLFLNTLPVRMDIGGMSYADLISACELQQTQLQGLKHFPLAAVVQQSGLDFSASMYNYTNFRIYGENNGDQQMAGSSTFEETNYRLAFQLSKSHSSNRHTLYLFVDPAVFDHAMGQRMIGYVKRIVTALTVDVNQRIDKQRLLGQSEQQQQLTEFNTPMQGVDKPMVAKWFEQQVALTPTATALVYEDQRLSYEQLNQQANRLAHHLIAIGVGAETPVGLCIERSIELSVAVWAIIKAGGYYVPLEPTYPASRLQGIIQGCGITVVLSNEDIVARSEAAGVATEDVQWLDINTAIASVSSGACDNNPEVEIAPQSLAYVIYTSGSTGQPKGAGISHQALVNRLNWMQNRYQLSDHDKVLHKTPFSFDVSVWELFWPHLCGAQLVLAKPQGHMEFDYLSQLINSEAVTLLHFVPSMLSAFLSHNSWQGCDSVRQVISSGEALAPNLVAQFYRQSAGRLDNLYGPTEATIDVSAWRCHNSTEPVSSVSIGKPIDNIQLYIVDDNIDLCPIGCIGELLIGGVGVGRGYVGQGGLTANSFIPDSFTKEPGRRLYRTGDLARFRSDGNIDYLGRIDSQIKLRGLRIELGEIEAVIGAIDGVTEVAVICQVESKGEARLVAYVVGQVSQQQLDSQMASQLPVYMLPQATVMLDAMPLNANGKLDRKALPEPTFTTQSFESPQTETEQQLAQLWCALLGLEQVSRDDHFFQLGGHSLMAIQLLSRIRQRFDVELSINTLFEQAILSELALEIDNIQLLDGLDEQMLENMSEQQAQALLDKMAMQ